MNISKINITAHKNKYDAIQTKKYRSTQLFVECKVDKRDSIWKYIDSKYGYKVELKSIMKAQEQLFYQTFAEHKHIYLFAVGSLLSNLEMHSLFYKIKSTEQHVELRKENKQYQLKYMDYIQNKSTVITAIVSKLQTNIYNSLLTKRNQSVIANNNNSDAYDITDNMKPPSQQRSKIDRTYQLEPNAFKTLQQLCVKMPDHSEKSYHEIMKATMLPKTVIYQMVRNMKRDDVEMTTNISKHARKKYWYLSGKSRFLKFDCHQEFDCSDKIQM
eukprot:337443_1